MLMEWFYRHLLPEWANDHVPDAEHPHRRRYTGKYRRKQEIVKNIWICSGLVMISTASPALIAGLSLGTTFLSFLILDETG